VQGEMHIAFNGKYLREFIDNAEGRVEMKLYRCRQSDGVLEWWELHVCVDSL